MPVLKPIKYKPEFCERIVELEAKGWSDSEVAVEFGVTVQTLYLWCNKFEDFKSARQFAEEKRRAYYQKAGRGAAFKKIDVNENLFRCYVGQFIDLANRTKIEVEPFELSNEESDEV